jgi:histone acetyltransferase (RNA polymerase elongator complex component)
VGCPHDCIFCNQDSITGELREEYNKITGDFVSKTIREYLETIDRKITTVEVSFFGGTFTAIDLRKQKELLAAAKKAKDLRLIDGIRLSTRPDYINLSIMENLKFYGVDTIELGVQSLDSNVLKLAKRGYEKEVVALASKLIKSFGMVLGHQLMVGLPGDTEEKDLLSVKESIAMKPDLVRIYPALVIRDTQMEKDYLEGTYEPYDFERAIKITWAMMNSYEENNVKIIRVGLQPTKEISLEAEVLAGPFHPSFRELAQSYGLNQRISKEVGDNMEIIIGEKDLSTLYAGGKKYFKTINGHKNITVTVVPGRLKAKIEIKYNEKGGNCHVSKIN